MSSSRLFQFIFTFIFTLLMLHIFFNFYFSNSLTSPHISSEETIIDPIVVALLGSFFSFIIGDVLVACFLNKYNRYCLNNFVEKGTRPAVKIIDEEFVPRPLIVDRLKGILQPSRNQSFYYLVCGEHGTGKTVLTKIASNEIGCGVIYINIPASFNELGEAFGEAINFAFGERISFTGQLMRKLKTNGKFSSLLYC
jgi:hypothetical protein